VCFYREICIVTVRGIPKSILYDISELPVFAACRKLCSPYSLTSQRVCLACENRQRIYSSSFSHVREISNRFASAEAVCLRKFLKLLQRDPAEYE
jgi:hypothetical protein